MESLYRKYRPKTFDDVVGQKHVVATLRRAVLEDRVSHAYLFCGPRGTGKTTMARLLAKALLCEQGAGNLPDGTCEECELIATGEHPDVYELDAASNTGVDNVREEIISRVSYAPVRGDYKIYIIDEVHMLTPAAFNALLKTLEEPPEHVVFIMCTTDPQKVLETILSRVQRFDFRPISNDELFGRLVYVCEQEGFTYEREALELVVLHARGGMRDALSDLERLATYTGGSISLEAAQEMLGEVPASTLSDVALALAARDVPRLFTEVADLTESGRDLLQFTRELTAHLRDTYVVAAVGEKPGVVSAQGEALGRLAEEARAFGPIDRISRAMAVLGDASSEMRTAPNQRLVLELAFTRIARPESDVTVDALAERVAVLETQLAQLKLNGVASANPASQSAVATQAAQTTASQQPEQTAASQQPEQPAASQQSAPAQQQSQAQVYTSAQQTPAQQAPAAQRTPQRQAAATPRAAQTPAQTTAPQARQENPVAQPAQASAITDPGELQRRWRNVTNDLIASVPSRGSLLMNSTIVSDDGQTLTVSLPKGSNFACKMLERPDVREMIAPAVTRAFGRRQISYVEGGSVGAAGARAAQPQPAQQPAATPQQAPAQQDPAHQQGRTATPEYVMPWDEPPYEEVPYSEADAAPYEEDEYFAPSPLPQAPAQQHPAPQQPPAQQQPTQPVPTPQPTQPAPAPQPTQTAPSPTEEAQILSMLTDVFGPGVTMSKVESRPADAGTSTEGTA